jgi:GTPase
VGKSTLLSVLTAARPEIADYPFTTLSPNLGVMTPFSLPLSKGENSGLVIADIPGLIEEAHEGKGLGVGFLKHVERCRVLVHVLAPAISYQQSADSKKMAEAMFGDYKVIRKELGEYSEELLKKPEVVVVNKIDLLQEMGDRIQAGLKKKGLEVLLVSAGTTEGVGELREKIRKVSEVSEVQ